MSRAHSGARPGMTRASMPRVAALLVAMTAALAAGHVQAQPIGIDNFNHPNPRMTFVVESFGSPRTESFTDSGSIVGGARTLEIETVAGGDALTVQIGTPATNTPRLSVNVDPATEGNVTLRWDGDTDPALNPIGLQNMDMTRGRTLNALRVAVNNCDGPCGQAGSQVTVLVHSGPGSVSTASVGFRSLQVGEDGYHYDIPFSNFSGTANFANVGAIELRLETLQDNGNYAVSTVESRALLDTSLTAPMTARAGETIAFTAKVTNPRDDIGAATQGTRLEIPLPPYTSEVPGSFQVNPPRTPSSAQCSSATSTPPLFGDCSAIPGSRCAIVNIGTLADDSCFEMEFQVTIDPSLGPGAPASTATQGRLSTTGPAGATLTNLLTDNTDPVEGNPDPTVVNLDFCGNGVVDGGEACDNPGVEDDFCTATCRIVSIEQCPAGQTCPAPSCTPGGPSCPVCTDNMDCESDFCDLDEGSGMGVCRDCGDGILDVNEDCDDGNTADGDRCSASCLIPPPRLGGGGCSATTSGAGLGLGLAFLAVLGWLRRRRRAAMTAVAALVAGSLGLAGPAEAQQEDARNFSAERFKLSSDRDGILDVESAAVVGHLNWDLGFWLGYADDPLAVYMGATSDRLDSFLTQRIGGEIVAALGLGSRLQLGVQVPVILTQTYDYMMDASLAPQSSAGIGDISIHPKLQLLFAADSGVDLAIIPVFTVPSRGSESYLGDVSLTFSPMLAASRSIDRIGLAANLGYRARANTPRVLGLEVVDEVFARFGASYRLNDDEKKPLELGLSMSLSTAAADLFGIFNRNHAEGLVGANYQATADWNLFAGGGVGINPGFGTPDWRALAGLRFTKRPLVCEAPRVPRDGRCSLTCEAPAVEKGDQCVVPPCPQGYQRAGDGCVLKVQCDGNPPNKDADCDTLPAPPWIQLGPPDEAYDRDRTEPRPPGEPVDPSGYKFGHDVPLDEGKPDYPDDIALYDYCPTVPGDLKHHGCPEPQVVVNDCTGTSGLGILSVSPPVVFLPDTDVLTLPSRVPLEELTRVVGKNPDLLVAINVGGPNAKHALAQRRANAIAKYLRNHGIDVEHISVVGVGGAASTAADDPASYPVKFQRRCPDKVPSTSDQLCKTLELGGNYQIQYEVNSAVIQPDSVEMLKRDVLWILRAHPQVRVRVEGHTSSEGKLDYNMDLSQRRARSVINYLISQGIAANRLDAVGHGPKIPLVSPERTAADRERNRRIEFSVQPRKECGTCEKFKVGKIQFEYNSHVIKVESFSKLDGVARKLLANPAVHLRIEGHTSSEGRTGHNRRLSGRRAAAVRKYLIDKGVTRKRLTSRGYGEDKLLVSPDDTEEQKEINRRVEFTITEGQSDCPE